MKKKNLVSSFILSTMAFMPLNADDNILMMFQNAKVSGDVRAISLKLDEKNAKDSYATAIGGSLKYTLATYNGFGGALSFITTNDIDALSGSGVEHNQELSGRDGEYNQVDESYISYKYDQFLFKFGRQRLETPLADSDDIRMVANSFNAYTAYYADDSFNVVLGHIKKWQGSDAGLDENWMKTGEDGVHFIGVSFEDGSLTAQGWYYNFDGLNNSLYLEVSNNYNIDKDNAINIAGQYLNQEEQDNSNISAEIFGVNIQSVVNGVDIALAYNKANKKKAKQSFSGYGGGTLFTNMDSMILDEITYDREVDAIVATLGYSFEKFDLSYAYGDFSGDTNSFGVKAHIVEQNIVIGHKHNENLSVEAVYVIDSNEEFSSSSEFNNNSFRVTVDYSF